MSAVPKYIVCDRGSQFDCDGFRSWCSAAGIKPRYGAVGQHRSIAVIERFHKTLKDECTRRIWVPYRQDRFRAQVSAFVGWYNLHRPHMSLNDCTPDEVYFNLPRANEQPRFEPRALWPDKSKCARPQVPIKGEKGCRMETEVQTVPGQPHLPIVTLRAA